MSDPSRLDLLRFTRRVVEQQAGAALRQIDGWIAAEERREAERHRREEASPPRPEWLLQHGLNPRNIDAVHTGDCWTAEGSDRCRPVSRDQAVEAIRHQVPACTFCRPDTALGMLE
ncbi:DUF6233 domain-containing protein [Streptomyces sp. ME02-6987-2C]|uniref:DUF6233 domain-containing protein n=1 Tax=unclassified Streptomyces TaxID=2593676 RepID=UPI0029A15125|nr:MULTISPECIES: DUF6233 domain-containing protein [unclassified Streptomyces]MDX3345952.1 DUF6233 domain-containing protein [Streptomyces sp. ME02-6979A]MDX3371408.1 DUF6233 domain-containing protein [Streptomyces sp. ME02-6987-2C]MDX3411627.1 DUF6233 domain-containing protein [Streptomyces sp. ME02-6977A]MDX3421718.1 DUF6233 domain-containing protein [Streptomyces sp. ME02-6985-2c]